MYNELAKVKDTTECLVSEMEPYCENSGDSYEIIFADDGSTDGCGDAVPTALPLKHGRVFVVRREVNLGKGAAVRDAVISSTGDVVMYTDCDLAYGTEIIPRTFETMKENGADMLAGSRAIHKDGYGEYTLIRKVASKVYIKLISLITGLSVTDSQCGFKMFRGDFAREVFPCCETNGWAFDLEVFLLAKKARAVVREVPVAIIKHDDSHVNVVTDSIKMLREVFRIKKRVNAKK